MPAKLVPWVVMMPEGWKPEKCDFCCQFGAEYCKGCELSTAKKAVEVQPWTIISLTTKDKEPGKLDLVHKVNSKPVTLYAVEMEEEK